MTDADYREVQCRSDPSATQVFRISRWPTKVSMKKKRRERKFGSPVGEIDGIYRFWGVVRARKSGLGGSSSFRSPTGQRAGRWSLIGSRAYISVEKGHTEGSFGFWVLPAVGQAGRTVSHWFESLQGGRINDSFGIQDVLAVERTGKTVF